MTSLKAEMVERDGINQKLRDEAAENSEDLKKRLEELDMSIKDKEEHIAQLPREEGTTPETEIPTEFMEAAAALLRGAAISGEQLDRLFQVLPMPPVSSRPKLTDPLSIVRATGPGAVQRRCVPRLYRRTAARRRSGGIRRPGSAHARAGARPLRLGGARAHGGPACRPRDGRRLLPLGPHPWPPSGRLSAPAPALLCAAFEWQGHIEGA
jgi:hypothetical protein